jgi:ectoine hydroxylase-related dioxygenase (phytanoyl-CoA dioxygenase family)
MSASGYVPFAPHAMRDTLDRIAGSEERCRVSPREVQAFRDHGFLVVRDLCDARDRLQVESLLQRLFERGAGFAEGNQFDMLDPDRSLGAAVQPQILKPSLYAPLLLQTRYFRRVQALALQLLGADAQFSFDHAIVKRAGSAAATPWHQDDAHHQDPHFQFEQISFWMPLQDVAQDNGCMRYLPGSNRGPLLPHRPLHGDSRMHALECLPEYFDASTALAQPVTAGSCILHDGRTLHGALPNRSGSDRVAYVIAFCGAPVARSDPQRYGWLERQYTARDVRQRRWSRRGGFAVLALRWLQRTLRSGPRSLQLKLRRLAQRMRG